MFHPFADIIGLTVTEMSHGQSRCSVAIDPAVHYNPHQVVHGAVLYALADTGMGAAVYPTLGEGESCATIEIKISYFRPVREGELVCVTEMLNRGRSVATLASRLFLGDKLVAQASGSFSIFKIG